MTGGTKRPPGGGPPAVRIEPENEWAWCGERRLDLTPKAFAVLRHFVEHAARLVTKDELLAAAWQDTVVSEAALTSCIRDLRRALTDSSRTPRYIETVHRRGFRFIGPIGAPLPAAASPMPAPPTFATPAVAPPPTARLVGRTEELARLHALLATARAGRRRVAFVTGEAGIGKTTVVEAFLAGFDGGDGVRVGRGQCVAQYGAGEAYMPVLEALGRMARDPGGDAVVQVLRQWAPTWLAQLPALLGDDDVEAVQRRARGSTRERMLRELSEAFDALAADVPLVLVLEDLHWSDSATVDLLAMLARRRDPARLFVLATYRPADVATEEHPLAAVKHELDVHSLCDELALHFLGEDAVGEYLARRFPEASFPAGFARFLHHTTSGNPLFLVNVVDDLVAQGGLRHVGGRWQLTRPLDEVAARLPHTLRHMVEQQVDRLTPTEQAMLAIGSVAGAEFSAALADADGVDAREGERCCAALVRRGRFLRALGATEWPDGTVAGCYGFIHALYRTVLYERVPIGHRVGLHLRIGARLERAHGAGAAAIAGELAMHFEHGRDVERAADYRRQAADAALRRHAHREATAHATRALELLAAFPESPRRTQQELALHTVLGAASIATHGWASAKTEGPYARARELCDETGATLERFPVLLGLSGLHIMRGEMASAREVTDQLLAVAESTDDAAMRLGAHNTVGLERFYRGEYVDALHHFEIADALYDPEQHNPNRIQAFAVDHDPGVSCGAHSAWTLWVLGHPDRAAARMRRCLDGARAIDHPLSLVMACSFAEAFYVDRGEREAVRELEHVRREQAARHGFDLFLPLADVYGGWLLAEDGQPEDGLARLRAGVAAFRADGAALGLPTFLGLLANLHAGLGQLDDALAVIADALDVSGRTGMHHQDAELQRKRGRVLLARRSRGGRAVADGEADAAFVAALQIARDQQATTYELRAATDLARLWHRQGRTDEARTLLGPVYARFDEGFATADLVAAKTLLDELGGRASR